MDVNILFKNNLLLEEEEIVYLSRILLTLIMQ